MRHRWSYPKRDTAHTNGANVPRCVYLTPANDSFLTRLANQSQTSEQTYLNELIEIALMAKRQPNHAPNEYQRLAVEAALEGGSFDE